MLTRLVARNFLLIPDAELRFSPHLNVLTGETGTGKSLLLDALGLALGARARADWVGPAGKELHVEADFRADRSAARLAAASGIPLEGPDLVLARRVRRGGPGACFVNGQRVPQRVLRRLGAALVEVHGQREEERFRLPEVQRELLDLFAGLQDRRRAVKAGHEVALAAQARLAAHHERLARAAQDEDWIRFQLREIETLAPGPGEVAALAERVRALRTGARRAEWLALAQELLNGRDGAVLDALETLDARAGELAAGEDDALREALRDLLRNARDVHRSVQHLAAEAGEAAGELPALEERLGSLEHLERKHRKPLAEILGAAQEMRASLAILEEGARIAAEIEAALAECRAALAREAAALRAGRETGGQSLARALVKELAALGLPDCRLRVALEPLATAREGEIDAGDGWIVGPAGGERVHLEAQTNPGAGFRPLGEIASGGEMSRVALGLRVVLGERGRRLMTVFDEIDAGLGATAGRAVARRLQEVARHRQVLLVTHMPVIAASAQRHFRVDKRRAGARTIAVVEVLSDQARVAEIARMLSGDAADAQACRHAQALLEDLVG